MREVLEQHLRAFNTRDLPALLAGLTSDAVWITGTSVIRGHAELTDFFGAAMRGLLPTLTVRSVVVQADRIAAELTEELVYAGERRTYFIAGFYLVHEGRIAMAKIYREGSATLD